ncbi:MAG: hypothetical protein QGG36_02095 [Pirellulaceae bacterium]|jgi:hypothetical protein|nr:hypothetical protein [Pirellulaceae bacterium]MDP7014571.1 hypothetical protein [Pirellulaceae bacterium]
MSSKRNFSVVFLLFIMAPLLQVRAEDDFVSRTARRALDRYLAEIDEIDKVAARRKAEAKRRLQKALDESGKFEAERGARYRGMLGSYSTFEGRIPFVMLSVPNGDNVFREYAKSVMNGRVDLNKALYSFHTRGHVVIPRDGAYYLEASRGHWDMKLNGVGYSLSKIPKHPRNRYAADIELTAGLYEVVFSVGNNGGQLPEAAIRIVDKQAERELPIFVYESELKKFWNDLSLGVELTETSKWTREEHRLSPNE